MKRLLPYHLPFLIISAILLAAGYYFLNQTPSEKKIEAIAEEIQDYLESEEKIFENFIKDELLLQRIADDQLSEKELLHLNNKKQILLIYKNDSLIFWNKNQAFPPQEIGTYQQYDELVKLKNGYYELIKKPVKLKDQTISVVAMIPVQYKYDIENKFLQNTFAVDISIPVTISLFPDTDEANYPVKNESGDTLFYIKKVPEEQEDPPSTIAVFLIIAGVVCLLLFLNYVALSLNKSFSSLAGFVFLILTFVLVRYLMLFEFYPMELKMMDFFNPKIYGSSRYTPSIGDLTINIVMVLWLVVFFFREVKVHIKKGKVHSFVITSISYLIILFLVFFIGRVVKSLVIDSSISFYVNNFLSLNIFSLVGLVCIAFMVISLYLFTYRILIITKVYKHAIVINSIALGTAAIVFILFTYSYNISFVYVVITGIIFILLLTTFIYRRIYILSFTSVIFWLIYFSIFTALLLNKYNADKEWHLRKIYAYNLAEDKDIILEYLFEDIKDNIKKDPFIKGYFQNPFITKRDLADRLYKRYFQDKLNRYNISIHTYIYDDVPYHGEQNIPLNSFYNQIDSLARRTSVSNLYYFPSAVGNFKYMALLPITDQGEDNLLGRVVLEMNPRAFSFSNVYPELLLQEDIKPPREFEGYDYAIYVDNKLQKHRGEYPYDLHLKYGFDEFERVEENGFVHLIYTPKEGHSIWISSEQTSIFEPVSLFSYIFGLFLLIVLIIIFIRFLYTLYHADFKLGAVVNFTFRNRIQFYIISIIVVSFLLIGTLTILNITRQYEDYHNQRLLRKVKQVLAGLEYLKDDLENLPHNWNSLFADEDILFQNITTLSDIHSMDINIYDAKGNLLSSSQPTIFQKGLITDKIDPVAYYNMQELQKSQYIQMEKIGDLSYLSAYVPVTDSERNITAILNLPYFAKEKNLESEISDFLVYFFNVYVLLLVFAGIIGLIISNSITRPISEIGNKLKQVKLGKSNEPIYWNINDEIGSLVNEYNKMIGELEHSADLLARSERESAWREMAKQVAHEIKNPLTPMKLSIQHLQRAYRDKAPNIDILIENVTNTLIEQIENLSSIASEFSSFAKMPVANKEMISINEVLKSIGDLYSSDNVDLKISTPVTEYFVFADKNQLLRVFTNLVKNAIQAIPDDQEGKIFIAAKREGEEILIKVEDNGSGIAVEQHEKVFVPNFTTKGSGMGLGLAISKNIIDQAGGKIWFESEVGKGTIFYITLPIFEDK